jgi:uncharacterized membrane protein
MEGLARSDYLNKHVKKQAWNEYGEMEIEDRIALITRVGVALSGIVVVAGVLLEALHSKHPFAIGTGPFGLHGGTVAAHESLLRIFGDVARGVAAGNSLAIVQAGIILLIATPWVRVALSIWLYVRQQDTRYATICVILLATMVAGLVLGA